MKRSPELTPLAHDHHKALFLAHRLGRAENLEEAIEELLAYWREQGRRHFEVEEDVLLPGWFEGDPDAEPEHAARLAAEHLEIRRVVRRAAAGEIGLDDLKEGAKLLHDHVRYEERELFPLIESRLDPEPLAALGAEIAAAEAETKVGRPVE